jgi:hypothetical protein
MNSNLTRSAKVIEAFKKQALANSTLHKIQKVIVGFDEDRQSDIRWARTGLIIMFFLLLAGLSFYFFGAQKMTIT